MYQSPWRHDSNLFPSHCHKSGVTDWGSDECEWSLLQVMKNKFSQLELCLKSPSDKLWNFVNGCFCAHRTKLFLPLSAEVWSLKNNVQSPGYMIICSLSLWQTNSRHRPRWLSKTSYSLSASCWCLFAFYLKPPGFTEEFSPQQNPEQLEFSVKRNGMFAFPSIKC